MTDQVKQEARKPSDYVRRQLDELEALIQRTGLNPEQHAHIAHTIASLAATLAHLEEHGQ